MSFFHFVLVCENQVWYPAHGMNVNTPRSTDTLDAPESPFAEIHEIRQETYSDIVTIDTAVHISAFVDERYPDGAYVTLSRLHDEDAFVSNDCHSTDYAVLTPARINEILEKTGAAYAVVPLWYKTYSQSAAAYLRKLSRDSMKNLAYIAYDQDKMTVIEKGVLEDFVNNISPILCTSMFSAGKDSKKEEYFMFHAADKMRHVDENRLYSSMMYLVYRQFCYLGKNLDRKDENKALRNIVSMLQAFVPNKFRAIASQEMDMRIEGNVELTLAGMSKLMQDFLYFIGEQRLEAATKLSGSGDLRAATWRKMKQFCSFFNDYISVYNRDLEAEFARKEISVKDPVQFLNKVAQVEKLFVPYIDLP